MNSLPSRLLLFLKYYNKSQIISKVNITEKLTISKLPTCIAYQVQITTLSQHSHGPCFHASAANESFASTKVPRLTSLVRKACDANSNHNETQCESTCGRGFFYFCRRADDFSASLMTRSKYII